VGLHQHECARSASRVRLRREPLLGGVAAPGSSGCGLSDWALLHVDSARQPFRILSPRAAWDPHPGLHAGTWPSFWTVFQTIEGGLGFWESNKYFAPTAKFRMNGSVDGYNHEVSTPGWEFGGKPLPGDQMGIAQLSSHLLIPPDGVTLAKDTLGQLFGYAWMALPLIRQPRLPSRPGTSAGLPSSIPRTFAVLLLSTYRLLGRGCRADTRLRSDAGWTPFRDCR